MLSLLLLARSGERSSQSVSPALLNMSRAMRVMIPSQSTLTSHLLRPSPALNHKRGLWHLNTYVTKGSLVSSRVLLCCQSSRTLLVVQICALPCYTCHWFRCGLSPLSSELINIGCISSLDHFQSLKEQHDQAVVNMNKQNHQVPVVRLR
jgi:hypothetical protein